GLELRHDPRRGRERRGLRATHLRPDPRRRLGPADVLGAARLRRQRVHAVAARRRVLSEPPRQDTNFFRAYYHVACFRSAAPGNQELEPDMKTGRNAPCPCGSGKKYKHCCLIASVESVTAS